MKNIKLVDVLATTLVVVWITSWFTAIWVEEYAVRLFFTGLFCWVLFLGIAAYMGSKGNVR